MRRLAAIAAIFLAVGSIASLAFADRAGAEIVVRIDKSTQRMAVLVDGSARHNWAVSTGLGGGPPSGTFRPVRLERKWFSRKYDWSPMPHAIFFLEGYAIHGTGYVSRLGSPASHGCVRLHPTHAATLFALVLSRGKSSTRIVISDSDWAGRPASQRRIEATAQEPQYYRTAPAYQLFR